MLRPAAPLTGALQAASAPPHRDQDRPAKWHPDYAAAQDVDRVIFLGGSGLKLPDCCFLGKDGRVQHLDGYPGLFSLAMGGSIRLGSRLLVVGGLLNHRIAVDDRLVTSQDFVVQTGDLPVSVRSVMVQPRDGQVPPGDLVRKLGDRGIPAGHGRGMGSPVAVLSIQQLLMERGKDSQSFPQKGFPLFQEAVQMNNVLYPLIQGCL